jgi:hypothetical protein
MRWIIAILLVCGTPSAKAEEWRLGGNSGVSCAAFLQYPAGDENWSLSISWLGGFLSSLNLVAAGQPNGGLLFEDIRPAIGWVTDFCRRNPETKFSTAACAYVLDVMNMKGAFPGDTGSRRRDFTARCISP